MDRSGGADEVLLELYDTWRKAESKAHRLFDESNDNYDDPNYMEAEKASTAALHDFLRKPTSSLHGILLKLRVACQFEDFMADALDPTCTLIGARAVVAAMHDLERMINTVL